MAMRFSYDTGTFEIGRYRGAPIHVCPTFFITAAVLAYPLWRTIDLRGLVLATIFIAIFFASILIHELAHAVTATRFRVAVERVDINMGGGLVHFRGWPHTMRQEFLITIAGPLCNLALGLAAIALLMQLPAPEPGLIVIDGKLVPERFPQPFMLEQILRATAYLNIGLCVVNLLPGIPLDGGKLVYLLVEKRWNARTALLTVSSLGMVFACINGFLLIGTIIAGCPIWAPPAFSANWEAFAAARRGPGNRDAVAFSDP